MDLSPGRVLREAGARGASVARTAVILAGTVEPLLYDHPQNHIGVVV